MERTSSDAHHTVTVTEATPTILVACRLGCALKLMEKRGHIKGLGNRWPIAPLCQELRHELLFPICNSLVGEQGRMSGQHAEENERLTESSASLSWPREL